MFEKYLKQDLSQPKYLFHGSPKILNDIKTNKSHDSIGVTKNIDTAVFLTPSFLIATAYSFKDEIKKLSIKSGLDYRFMISNYETFPIMKMENVCIPENLEGYLYVFEFNKDMVNDPVGSLQYKSYTDLKPIDIIKIYYDDFKVYYEITPKTR